MNRGERAVDVPSVVISDGCSGTQIEYILITTRSPYLFIYKRFGIECTVIDLAALGLNVESQRLLILDSVSGLIANSWHTVGSQLNNYLYMCRVGGCMVNADGRQWSKLSCLRLPPSHAQGRGYSFGSILTTISFNLFYLNGDSLIRDTYFPHHLLGNILSC